MKISRRAVITITLAGAAARPALAQMGPRRVDPMQINPETTLGRGPMAGNLVARSFRLAPGGMMAPKALPIADLRGDRRLERYLGKVVIIPVWADWCAPCLVELSEMAALQGRIGARAAFLPILSGPNSWTEPADVAAMLAKAKAAPFAPLMEARSGSLLYRSMTSDAPPGQTPGSLPCTLLLDPDGRVAARQWGANGGAAWSTPAAEAFTRALLDGRLGI